MADREIKEKDIAAGYAGLQLSSWLLGYMIDRRFLTREEAHAVLINLAEVNTDRGGPANEAIGQILNQTARGFEKKDS
jgi:hypothetical protein